MMCEMLSVKRTFALAVVGSSLALLVGIGIAAQYRISPAVAAFHQK
jgi:hypothetical protein